MEYGRLNPNKGVAGLNILLSVVSILFMIGIIIMIFTIAGSKLKGTLSTKDYKTLTTVTNESAFVNATGDALAGASNYKAEGYTITDAYNTTDETSNGSFSTTHVAVSSAGVVTNATANLYPDALVSYTYYFLQDTSAITEINDTYQSLGEVSDWYPTFIVLTAMVVLILLLAIIINSIRGSGLMGEGGA